MLQTIQTEQLQNACKQTSDRRIIVDIVSLLKQTTTHTTKQRTKTLAGYFDLETRREVRPLWAVCGLTQNACIVFLHLFEDEITYAGYKRSISNIFWSDPDSRMGYEKIITLKNDFFPVKREYPMIYYTATAPVIPDTVKEVIQKSEIDVMQMALLWQPKVWSKVPAIGLCPAIVYKENGTWYLLADWIDTKKERKFATIHLLDYCKGGIKET